MSTGYQERKLNFLPEYKNNAVLQMVIVCGVGYVLFLFTAVCFQAFAGYSMQNALNLISPFVALPSKAEFFSHPWTLLTYEWSHWSFWDWVSNMVWLFCFGNVLQSLIGHRQLIPLYFLASVAAGLAYIAAQYIPAGFFQVPAGLKVLDARAGVTAIAFASFTLAPKFRFYLGDRLSIPILPVLVVYVFLQLLAAGTGARMVMLAAAALSGFGYIRMLQAGINPGNALQRIQSKLDNSVKPPVRTIRDNSLSQKNVDRILDKILQKGVKSLTHQEREILRRAGKDEG